MRIVAISIISVALLTACGSDKKEKEEKKADTVIKTEVKSTNVGDLTIAYYDVERMAEGFEYFKKTMAQLEKEGRELEKNVQYWQSQGQEAAMRMQQGTQNGTLTSADMDALDRKYKQAEKNIRSLESNYMEFQQKQAELSQVFENKLSKAAEDFSKANGIKLLLARAPGSGIVYIEEGFDVSDSFIQYLNARQEEFDQFTGSEDKK